MLVHFLGGGPASCPWSINNCGPNDEPFSFHPAGANALFMDGHVSMITNTVDPRTMRKLVSRSEGVPLTQADLFE